MLGSNKVFGPKKNFGPKRFWIQNCLELNFILGPNKNLVTKKLGSE